MEEVGICAVRMGPVQWGEEERMRASFTMMTVATCSNIWIIMFDSSWKTK
jgi:hypothetical protein